MAVASALLKARSLLTLAALSMLTACASRPVAERVARGPAPLPRAPVLDASYDWHGQVIVPFGVLLKSSAVPLHEVLLFHDNAPGVATPAADAESKDCYTIDGAPPRLVGHTPDAYLLCFDHDRLNRIESTVHLAADDAVQVFERACTSWQSGGVSAPPTAGVCEGRSGTTSYTAHLASEPGGPAILSLTLLNANPVP